MAMIQEHIGSFYPGSGGEMAPLIYAIDLPEHPFDFSSAAVGLKAHVLAVPVDNWDQALTPWEAPALYREQPSFGGQAAGTLRQLITQTLPQAEAQYGLRPSACALAGYSLGGLFTTWAFLQTRTFAAMASLSGSLWFPGWVEYCQRICDSASLEGRFAYFSVGTGEKRASSTTFRQVEANTQETAHLFELAGADVAFQTSPGKHFDHVVQRWQAGLGALDDWLTTHFSI